MVLDWPRFMGGLLMQEKQEIQPRGDIYSPTSILLPLSLQPKDV